MGRGKNRCCWFFRGFPAGKDAVLNKLKIVHSPIAHITTMTARQTPKGKRRRRLYFVTIEQFQKLIDDNELLE